MSEFDKFLKHLGINPDEMQNELLQKVEAEENKRHGVCDNGSKFKEA